MTSSKKYRFFEPKSTNFHLPISRNKIKCFLQSKVQLSIVKDKATKSLEVNRDILTKLLSTPVQSRKPIDEKALQYPLSPVPLSLCNADGTMRKTNKCDLMKLILQSTNDSTKIKEQNSVCIIDLMAAVRTVREIPDRFQDFVFKIIKSIPTGDKRVDIVADSYWPNSIKISERTKYGLSEKILIKSSKSKIPHAFSKFLSSSENKKRLIELLFDVFEKNCVKMLNFIQKKQVSYFHGRFRPLSNIVSC